MSDARDRPAASRWSAPDLRDDVVRLRELVDADAADMAAAGEGHRGRIVYSLRRLSTELPPGHALDRPALGDLDEVAAVLVACDLADRGEADARREELTEHWHGLPHFSLDRDAWIVRDADGTIVAYAWVWDETPGKELIAEHAVHPDHRGRGIGEALLTLIERHAGRHAALSPAQAVSLGVFADSRCGPTLALFRRHGFSKTREFQRMRIPLDQAPPVPAWPLGIDVRAFRRGQDEAAAHTAMDEAFSEDFRASHLSLDEWTRLLLANPAFDDDLFQLAWDGHVVAGAVLCYVESAAGRGVVDMLGVRTPWRRHGLGTALLLHGLHLLRQRGCPAAQLGVDTENATGAQRIYVRAGMRPVARTEFFEKHVAPA